MAGRTSRVNQRVDRVRVSDEPHEKYYGDGRPVLTDTKAGKLIDKEVEAYTVLCPDCGEVARYDQDELPICPACGMVCTGDTGSMPRDNLVRDPKAAGRVSKDPQ